MKISTKGRYGLRALIDIYIYSSCEAVTLKNVSIREEIPEKYLEQIFASLRRGGIIKGKKGPQGGYHIEEGKELVTIGEILKILEGDLILIDKEKEGPPLENFIYNNLWEVINNNVNDFFNSITLKDLGEKYKNSIESIVYYI